MDATLHNRLKAFHSILSFIGIKKLSGMARNHQVKNTNWMSNLKRNLENILIKILVIVKNTYKDTGVLGTLSNI